MRRVIFKAMKTVGSNSRVVARGGPTHEAQFTYNGTKLEEEYAKKKCMKKHEQLELLKLPHLKLT